MTYANEMASSGFKLFRWRSYVPLLFLALILFELRDFTYSGGSQRTDLLWESVCLLVSFSGLLFRSHVIGHCPAGTSGRNTHGQVAETLNTTGLYSIVRHPLYFGNYLMWLGIVLFLHDWMLTALISACYWIYYERIMVAEEAFLRSKYPESYDEWADRTPAFLPRLSGYVKPPLPFSIRQVLRREYSGYFAVVLILFCLEVSGDYVVEGRLQFEPVWVGFLVASFVIYITLRSLKKYTSVLDVAGR